MREWDCRDGERKSGRAMEEIFDRGSVMVLREKRGDREIPRDPQG